MNLDSAKFYVGLAGAVIVVLAFVLGVASAAGDWMTNRTDRHIHDGIKEAVKPPDGIIYGAVKIQIKESEKPIEDQINAIEKQMIRQDYMMSEVYQSVTGRQPPPKAE